MRQQLNVSAARHITRARIGLVATLLAAFVAFPLAGFAQAKPKLDRNKTLYHRIGGYDMLADVTDDFLDQLRSDPAFARFGQGRSHDSLVRARQLIVDQLCWLTDGPCVYIGRDMKTVHTGLAITQAEFDLAGKKLKASLDKFKVAEPEQQEFMAIVSKLGSDIVEKTPEAKPAAKPTTN